MQEKNVVVIGGGPGTDIMLSGLKRYTSELTALVSTFDVSSHTHAQNGNSTAQAADEVRSSLLALGADPATTTIMEQLFAYRFVHPSDLSNYTFGNLFLSALTEITGAADLALQAAARVLNVQGQVLPVTLQECPLVAELTDGSEVTVSSPHELISAASEVGLHTTRLLQPAPALEAALQAIRKADIIVVGPADLYFGILAPLQLDGMREALAESSAIKVFICNLMTQPHTTADWPVSRFIRTVQNHMGGPGSLDCVVVNSAPLASEIVDELGLLGSSPVHFDLDECLSLGLSVIVRPVASSTSLLHDSEKLARTVLFLGGGRSARRADKRRIFTNGSLADVLPSIKLMPTGAET